MSLINDKHRKELRQFGWYTRGYLPHFDGRALPQFITLHLADAVPKEIIDGWKIELRKTEESTRVPTLHKQIERFVDKGHGKCFLKDHRIAGLVQESLLNWHQVRYHLFAWVIMPNHSHSLLTRYGAYDLRQIIHTHKSFTAHEANSLLGLKGQFWMEDYFDRYIRDEQHFVDVVRYIENNPVKAGLCEKPGDWPFSSAWFRKMGGSPARWR